MHQVEYARSFDDADYVFFPPLGRSGLPQHEHLDLERLVQDLAARGTAAEMFGRTESIVERLVTLAEPGDTIALLSNGAFDGIHRKLLGALDT